MQQEILNQVESSLGQRILRCDKVVGGDINHALRLELEDGDSVFIKYNTTSSHKLIIESEYRGLQLLSSSGINTPEIITQHSNQVYSYLLLEYISASLQNLNSYNNSLAQQLALLHQCQSDYYGLDYDNAIGSLEQKNTQTANFFTFYVESRIGAQYGLAKGQGFLSDVSIDSFYKNIEALIPPELPTLVHGDIWNGNVMMNTNSEAVFIDPSVAYSHREFDIAMMKLFGGFDNEVFLLYNEILPLNKGWEDRLPLFQLYYLLVHLNLFGGSYEGQVRRIFSQFL